jgi:NitT/TauT family transport system ATP-binding protein
MTGDSLIQLDKVSKLFPLESGGEILVLDKVDIQIFPDEIVALLGPSGSGKSTLLRIMAGLVPKSSGDVLLGGKALDGVNSNVSLVFQSFALFPWETVQTNIELALKPLSLSSEDVTLRVKNAIDIVGLEGFEEAYPRELSGGMKQRVGIARALVMERPIMFLDEPFSALDVLIADTLRGEIVKLFLEKKTPTRTFVLVTHNIQEAVLMANRILVMGTHPGHIRAEIPNPLLFPRDEDSLPFRQLVREIRAIVSESLFPNPVTPNLTPQKERESVVESLPHVPIGEVIGLLVAIGFQEGQEDIFELAQSVGKEFGRTLYLVKAAELLEFIDTPQQQVVLTELGHRFVQGDINLRKKMLHESFGKLRITKLLVSILKKKDPVRMPLAELKEAVALWLPHENPMNIVKTLISWGRFAEFFGYNDDSKELYLDTGQDPK